MKSIVVHIVDSVCKANNRDPEGEALIAAGRTFGTVESLDAALAAERAKYQAEINQLRVQNDAEVADLKAELESIKAKAVTDEELAILEMIRAKSAREAAGYECEIKRRDDQIVTMITDMENRREQVRAAFGF